MPCRKNWNKTKNVVKAGGSAKFSDVGLTYLTDYGGSVANWGHVSKGPTI